MFGILLVYLLIFFYPFINLQIISGDINVPIVDILALILLPYVIFKKFGKFELKWDFPGFFFYLFWLVAAGVSLINVHQEFDFNYCLQYFFRPVGFFYLMYVILPWQFIRTPRRLEDVFKIFYILGILASVMGLVSYLTSSAGSFFVRVAAPISILGFYPLGTNHNQIAELLVVAIPISFIFLWLEKDDQKKKWIFLGISLMVMINFLTFSRSGWLALFFELLILAIIQYRYHLVKIFRYSFILLIIIFPLILFLYSYTQQTQVASSTSSRVFLTNIALDAWRDHPLIGNGVGTFRSIVSRNKIFTLEFGGAQDPHGFIQQTLSDTGVVGFVAFISLLGFVLFTVLKTYWQYRKDHYWRYVLLSVFVASCGEIVFQAFQTSYFNSKLWVPLGIALISAMQAQKYGNKNTAHN